MMDRPKLKIAGLGFSVIELKPIKWPTLLKQYNRN